ncbi:MAG: hypothetical protein H6Q70_483 [Firmicutes bacterium]|nr:hypothetical protein [Bacillota bacterium]
MELQVISNVQEFKWNFEDIKKSLQESVQKYTGLVVNEDNLKDMEKTQKEIASIRTQINAFQKKVKKDLELPYKQFEKEIKELQSLVAEAENPIKDQILKYENVRIENCEKELKNFAKNTAESLGLRSENFNLVIDSKWTNRTAKKASVRKEIVAEIENQLKQQQMNDEAAELLKQKNDLIKSLCKSGSAMFNLATPITSKDVKHLTINAGLAEIPEIISQECKKRSDMERKAAEEIIQPATQPMPPVAPAVSECPQSSIPTIAIPPINAPVEFYKVILELPSISYQDSINLQQFMANSNIQYRVVSQEKKVD